MFLFTLKGKKRDSDTSRCCRFVSIRRTLVLSSFNIRIGRYRGDTRESEPSLGASVNLLFGNPSRTSGLHIGLPRGCERITDRRTRSRVV